MNAGQVNVLKEAVLVYQNVTSLRSPKDTEESHKNPQSGREEGRLGDIRNGYLLNTSSQRQQQTNRFVKTSFRFFKSHNNTCFMRNKRSERRRMSKDAQFSHSRSIRTSTRRLHQNLTTAPCA